MRPRRRQREVAAALQQDFPVPKARRDAGGTGEVDLPRRRQQRGELGPFGRDLLEAKARARQRGVELTALQDKGELARAVDAACKRPARSTALRSQLQSARRGGRAGDRLSVQRHLALDAQIRPETLRPPPPSWAPSAWSANTARSCSGWSSASSGTIRRPSGVASSTLDVAGRDPVGQRQGRQLGWPVVARGHDVQALQPEAVLIDAAAQRRALDAHLLRCAPRSSVRRPVVDAQSADLLSRPRRRWRCRSGRSRSGRPPDLLDGDLVVSRDPQEGAHEPRRLPNEQRADEHERDRKRQESAGRPAPRRQGAGWPKSPPGPARCNHDNTLWSAT